jgi:hypothetical protein
LVLLSLIASPQKLNSFDLIFYQNIAAAGDITINKSNEQQKAPPYQKPLVKRTVHTAEYS